MNTFILNFKSVYEEFCVNNSNNSNNSDQVMVYGFDEPCKYRKIYAALNIESKNNKQAKIKKVFSCAVGDNGYKSQTVEGRKIEQIEWTSSTRIERDNRMCKAGITNMVLENYKRTKSNLPIIPVIFCIDIDGGGFLKVDSTRLTAKKGIDKINKNKEINSYITHKEMRRAYKLCTDKDVDQELQAVARQTFRFAKVHKKSSNSKSGPTYSLSKIPAPREEADFTLSKDFIEKWSARIQNRSILARDKFSWRKQLQMRKEKYDKGPSMFNPADKKTFNVQGYDFAVEYISKKMLNGVDVKVAPTLEDFTKWARNQTNDTRLEKIMNDSNFKELYTLGVELAFQ